MSTSARIFVAAVVLLATLEVATLGAIGPIEAAALWVMFAAWAVLTVLWVVVPAVGARHPEGQAMSGRSQLWVIVGVVAAAIVVVSLIATFPGQGGASPHSSRGAPAATR